MIGYMIIQKNKFFNNYNIVTYLYTITIKNYFILAIVNERKKRACIFNNLRESGSL